MQDFCTVQEKEGVETMSLCDDCNGACCRIMFFPMRKPMNKEDKEWFEMHDGCKVNGLMLEFEMACRHLDKETGKCLVYDERPLTCKKFKVGGAMCLLSRRMFYKTEERK